MLFFKAFWLYLFLAPIRVSSSPQATRPDINPYIGKALALNKEYARKLEQTVQYFISVSDTKSARRTRTVQKISTFFWVAHSSHVPDVRDLIEDALKDQTATSRKHLVQIVVYNMLERDCSANASDGEFHLADDGLNKYKRFIDAIVAQLTSSSARLLDFALILEPDAVPNLVTSMEFEECANAALAYKEALTYAINKFQLPNVALYLDAGHGGWLGTADALQPVASMFGEILKLAQRSSPSTQVRGLAINVSNYNRYIAPIQESYAKDNPSWDEFHYVNNLTPLLNQVGFPAHFIVDQGRAGRGGIRTDWEQWCNLRNAGFGTRPTSDQAILKNSNVDAIVWVKPGGESDGPSEETSDRFDKNCESPVSHVPSPEAGEWFNDYVVDLVKNAEPPLEESD